MRTVGDLMTRDVITLFDDSTLADARAIMKQRGVRHIPVINGSTGELLGLLTQRAMLTVALNIADQIGIKRLEKVEAQTKVTDIMEPVTRVFTEDDTLLAAADYLLANKNTVLCVVRGKEVAGVVSSVDFIRCARHFLQNGN